MNIRKKSKQLLHRNIFYLTLRCILLELPKLSRKVRLEFRRIWFRLDIRFRHLLVFIAWFILILGIVCAVVGIIYVIYKSFQITPEIDLPPGTNIPSKTNWIDTFIDNKLFRNLESLSILVGLIIFFGTGPQQK